MNCNTNKENDLEAQEVHWDCIKRFIENSQVPTFTKKILITLFGRIIGGLMERLLEKGGINGIVSVSGQEEIEMLLQVLEEQAQQIRSVISKRRADEHQR